MRRGGALVEDACYFFHKLDVCGAEGIADMAIEGQRAEGEGDIDDGPYGMFDDLFDMRRFVEVIVIDYVGPVDRVTFAPEAIDQGRAPAAAGLLPLTIRGHVVVSH